jgi:stress-induced morphogen
MDLVHEMTMKLQRAFPDGEVVVRDPNHDGAHFEATIVCPRFAGMGRVQQHRMVYAALGDMLDGAVHALALVTRAK